MTIKILLFLMAIALAAPASGAPKRLKGFGDIMDALRSGREVRAVLDWSSCTLLSLKKFTENPEKPGETADPRCRLTMHRKPAECYYKSDHKLNAVSGIKLDTWEYFGPGFISPRGYVMASETKLISLRGFVLNYGSVRIADDGSVSVTVNYLRPATAASADPEAEDIPLRMRKSPEGKEETRSRTLSQQEYVIVMDERFSCGISRGKNGKGASFFAER